MEFRSFNDSPIEVRQAGDRLSISGYASVFNSPSQDLGGFIEVIKAGAFDQSLAEVRSGQRDVVARFNHEGGFSTLARTANKSLELSTDSHGLRYVATLPATQTGRDVHEMVRTGLINKSSFAFRITPADEQWNFRATPPVRTITRVDLIDVAPVDQPAYEGTSVSARAMADAELEYWDAILRGIILRGMKENNISL